MSREALLNNRSIRKQILLTPVDSDHLKLVSDHTGLSQNEIINKGLNAYLARYKKLFSDSTLEPLKIEGSNLINSEEE